MDPDKYKSYKTDSESARLQGYQSFLETLIRHTADANATPSNFARTVIMMLTREARNRLDGINQECDENESHPPGWLSSIKNRILAMCFLLRTLLRYKVADIELINSFAHLDAIIPKSWFGHDEYFLKKLTELVLLMYQDIVYGRISLRTPERQAALANWHPLLKSYIDDGQDFDLKVMLKQVTAKLFSTLPFKDQMEFLKALEMSGKCFNDFISDYDLELMLSKCCSWPAVWNSSADNTSIFSESASKD